MSADESDQQRAARLDPGAGQSSPLSPSVSPGDYAPSPNTSSQALTRAQQLRVQNLLRKLLLEPDEHVRLDTLRVLRKTLRELDFQLSWLTQVDFLETLERVLRQASESTGAVPKRGEQEQEENDTVGSSSSWRLVHDATQLLIESVARLVHEIDAQLIESIVPSVVENLGHQRSEVRRASLLLLNALLHQHTNQPKTAQPKRANLFKLLLRLFIDYGLTNYRNQQAQRGAILSLPLLMSEQLVHREDLAPLVRCLSELLLVDSNEHLFYSLYLAMQRLHLMIGDDKFRALLARCEPEAAHLYWQAASRQNSLVPGGDSQAAAASLSSCNSSDCNVGGGGNKKKSPRGSTSQQFAQNDEKQVAGSSSAQKSHPPVERDQPQQHVTFKSSGPESEEPEEPREQQQEEEEESSGREREVSPEGAGREEPRPSVRRQSQGRDNSGTPVVDANEFGPSGGGDFSPFGVTSSTDDDDESEQQKVGVAAAATRRAQFSSDVSSTCSSDAHLVNPAHYMTRAALAGHPLDHYEEIHHVDHSNMQSLAINDFGPICNTPTVEIAPLQLANSSPLASHSTSHFSRNQHHLEYAQQAAGAQVSSELKFGIFPKHLIQVALQSPRASDRYEAMQELMCLVRESPINHLAILMTYFDSFLEQFLSKILLNQQASDQFKLELVAIDMIETIIIKTKVSTMQYIRPIVSLLMRALIVDSHQQGQDGAGGGGGGKSYHQLTAAPSLFRESTCRVLHKMMAYLPPQHVIDALFEHKHQRAPVVREEAVNRVTAAILEYDRQEFNLTKLCYHILPMLADPQASVRLASLECIATLANALGPERIGSLLTAAEAVQSGCDYDGLLLGAINARLMRHTLPRCQSNGVVRYVLRPHLGLSGGVGGGVEDRSKLPADVRWVLEAPSAHQQHPGGPYYHPHAHHGQHSHSQGAHPTGEHPQQQQQQQVQEGEHQHHRLGVYSPPTQAERRRRSSVGLGLLRQQGEHTTGGQEPTTPPGSHQHHHSIARAHRSTSMVTGAAGAGASGQSGRRSIEQETAARRGRSSSDHSKAEVQTQQNDIGSSSSGGGGGGGGDEAGSQDKSETHHQPSVVARNDSEKEQPIAKRRESRVSSQGAVAVGAGKVRESAADKVEQPPTAPSEHCNCKDHQQHHIGSSAGYRQERPAYRRSNSQDSVSSTDTNKVLFQYYLGKFRQSLAESPGNHQAVLPSDSIIYTDVEQAYELTRHRTRFQQTSFDYEADSVGRVPEGPSPRVGPATVTAGASGRSRRKSSISNNNSGRQQQDNMTSQRPGPEVDECPTSGSESEPQTVLENPKRVESQESQAQAQPRQRPILTRSGKSIQRQATIERDHPERPQEAAAQEQQQQRSSPTTPAASRRQSVASNASGLTRHPGHAAASSGQSSRAGSLGDGEQSGRQSRANSGPDEPRARRQRSQSIASRASSNAASEQQQVVVSTREQPSRDDDPAGGGGGEMATAATISSSTASEDTSRPSTEGGVEQRSGGRERRRRRSSSQRRRSNAGSDEPRPPGDIEGALETNEKQQQEEEETEAEARVRRRASRSQPPVARARPAADSKQQQQGKSHQDRVKLVPIRGGHQEAGLQSRRACSVSPSLSSSVNIRHILETVAQSEGPFAEPQLAHKVALSALDSPCWSTKVEGILALIRLVAFHAHPVILSSGNITHDTTGRLHEIVTKVAEETRNLRSTVARSAIFALGDFCARLERVIEPELDLIVHALLLKSTENTAFIRDDIRRSLTQMVDHLTPWRLASALLHHGAQHKSVHVRRMASQFVAALVERLGPARCLVGAREISAQLLPAAARFAQDQSPHTRFHGRLMLAKLMHHNSFERLLRRTLTSQLYRSTIGIIESVKRRGPGEPPADLA